MLSGLSVTLFYVFQHKGVMFIPGTAFLGEDCRDEALKDLKDFKREERYRRESKKGIRARGVPNRE